MRILMLIDSYPPIIGGAQQYVRNLSIALSSRGHDVAVATLGNPGQPPLEDDAGVRVYRLRGALQRATKAFSDPQRTYAPPVPDPELTLAIRDIIRQEQPDIVHSHNWMGRSYLPIKRWSKAKHVVSLHDFSRECATWIRMRDGEPCSGPGLAKCLSCAGKQYGKAKGAAITLGNWAMKAPERALVDMFVPVSEAALQDGLKASGAPFRIIPNFVPDDVADPPDDPLGYRDRLPADGYLLFVGSLIPPKGIETLFEAYAGLTSAPPLVAIGGILPTSPTEFPPNVVVHTNWPHAAVMTAWRHSMAGLVPSICYDLCPTVAMEAMAAGKPVIASRIGGIPDIVADQETGILVPPGDADALRSAMATLIDDPALAARMGAAGLQHVNRFFASTVVTEMESMYGELIA